MCLLRAGVSMLTIKIARFLALRSISSALVDIAFLVLYSLASPAPPRPEHDPSLFGIKMAAILLMLLLWDQMKLPKRWCTITSKWLKVVFNVYYYRDRLNFVRMNFYFGHLIFVCTYESSSVFASFLVQMKRVLPKKRSPNAKSPNRSWKIYARYFQTWKSLKRTRLIVYHSIYSWYINVIHEIICFTSITSCFFLLGIWKLKS